MQTKEEGDVPCFLVNIVEEAPAVISWEMISCWQRSEWLKPVPRTVDRDEGYV
jgi:hypothetical protein